MTREFRARTDETEYGIVSAIVDQFAELGTKISRNDVLRLLIRYGWDSIATGIRNQGEARKAIERHWVGCPWCSEQRIGCPWGKSLKDTYDALSAPRKPAPKKRLMPPMRPETSTSKSTDLK